MGLKADIVKHRQKLYPIPKGWRTSKQISKQEAMSIPQVWRALRPLLESGAWETQPWPVQEASGIFKPQPIYRKKP